MNILRVKLLVTEPEYYRALSNNKGDGIAEYGNCNGGKFFETSFRMPVYIIHDGKNLVSAGNSSLPAN